MLFHWFFNDRLKVPSVVKPLTIYTHLEACCFFLLFEYHLGIIFLPKSVKPSRDLYFTNRIKKAKCTNKYLQKKITKFSNVAPKPDIKTCFS